ncbi:hypothetical protein L208DRAFT_1377095 [Tricholoma matsutake]|nr:hypothetical protein L208DRAFT_1377095 [Tricholoma matsutake 945]
MCCMQHSEEVAIGVDFICMLNLVQFVAKIEAIQHTCHLKSAAAVMKQEQKVGNLDGFTNAQLTQWKASGYKFAVLAGAGLYGLLALHGIAPSILCSDLLVSDAFFDSFAQNVFTTPRCAISWGSCYNLCQSSDSTPYSLSTINCSILTNPSSQSSNCGSSPAPPSPLSKPKGLDSNQDHDDFFDEQTPYISHREIQTAFDPDHPLNCKMPFQSQDVDYIHQWTIRERKKADAAIMVESIEELEEMLVEQLKTDWILP